VSAGDTRERLEILEQAIAKAEALYGRLKRKGVQFDPTTGPAHLKDWSEGVRAFRSLARL